MNVAQLHESVFYCAQNFGGVVLAGHAAVDRVLRDADDAPQQRLLLNDDNVAFQIVQLGETVIQ